MTSKYEKEKPNNIFEWIQHAYFIFRQKGFISFLSRLWRAAKHEFRNVFGSILVQATPRTFTYKGKRLDLFYHQYNHTWSNERCIEIPLILDEADLNNRPLLEIGNVLNHYRECDWDVIDKYETKSHVTNKDILDVEVEPKYSLILSISTLEHIGIDEGANPAKAIKALERIKSLLQQGGKLIFTVPVGYNTALDKYLIEERNLELSLFKRISWSNEWKQAGLEEVKNIDYNHPYENGNGVLLGTYER